MKSEFEESYFTIQPDYFLPKVNITKERHKLFNRKQGATESLDTYVTDLKYIALHCNFGPLTDDILKDIFSWNLYNSYIKEKIISVQPTTLDDAVAIVKHMEATKAQDDIVDNSVNQISSVDNVKPSSPRRSPDCSSPSPSISKVRHSCSQSLEKHKCGDHGKERSTLNEAVAIVKHMEVTKAQDDIVDKSIKQFSLVDNVKPSSPKQSPDCSSPSHSISKDSHSCSQPLERHKHGRRGKKHSSSKKCDNSEPPDKPLENVAISKRLKKNMNTHIKKPLNAFMLFLKEMRPKIIAEYTLKESSTVNWILGKRWHSLSREEKAKYYEKAKVETQLHQQLYPNWRAKKKKSTAVRKVPEHKKCRARYGLLQKDRWCKPCRRKKKCVYNKEAVAAASETVVVSDTSPKSPCFEEDIKLELEESDTSNDGYTLGVKWAEYVMDCS